MEKINIDTDKIKECGRDIANLSVELNTKIDELFDELFNVKNKNIWLGKSADEFIISCKTEKKQYKHLVNSLYNEGKFLYNTAQSFENAANKLKD